jgi:type II secretory pathway pseudopilin PulG
VRSRRQAGFSYLEVLVALLVIVLSLPPALQAMRIGLQSADVQAQALPLAQRAAGALETVLAQPFATLRTEAARVNGRTVPTSYSDAAGTRDRMLVFLSYYDAGNSDGDNEPFTILDANSDGDANPYTGGTPYIGLLWVHVQIEGTAIAFETLTSE